jgi:beta-glucosidase
MTLEEKVAQLLCIWVGKEEVIDEEGTFLPDQFRSRFPDGLGNIARPNDGQGLNGDASLSPRKTVQLVNAVQRFAVEETRLGIPVMFHEEGLHGNQAIDATSFPVPIALAGTFDPELVEHMYSVVAREIAARGARQTLTPVVDLVGDPRWGRTEETFGEDPYLVTQMGLAAVRGFQGPARPIARDRVVATLKHMTGHGQPESGTNIGPAHLGERELRDRFLPPFEAAIEAGALSVMASYNEIDGVPSHVNPFLLDEILRKEWDFRGHVVADYFAIGQLVSLHNVVSDIETAAVEALEAGVDVELPDPEAFPTLVQAVRQGRISESLVDRAVSRMLYTKFESGLFEYPYADPDLAENLIGNEEASELALKVARRSIVLLKNDQNLLPLDEDLVSRIAVIGPNAKDAHIGGYPGVPRETVGVLEGIRRRMEGKAEVVYAEGVRITESSDWWADEVVFTPREENLPRIREAVRLARDADVVVLVIGGNEQTSREAWADNHLGDRASLELVGDQPELFDALLETGVPMAVVMIHGRPLAIERLQTHADAILDGWYLGQAGGVAVAEALFGDFNPGAKLAISVPGSSGHIPVYYNHKPTGRRGYVDASIEPLYPFGFGLSYTRFQFGAPRLSATTTRMRALDSVFVEVMVTNTGDRTGDEVVQLYIRDVVSSATRPVKELRRFERITLDRAETRTVRFHLEWSDFAFHDRQMERVVEPGELLIMTGPDSRDLQEVNLTGIE